MGESTNSSITPQGLISISEMNPEAQVSITVEGYKQMCAHIAKLEAENHAMKNAIDNTVEFIGLKEREIALINHAKWLKERFLQKEA